MLESKRRAIIFLSISFALAVIAGYLFYVKVQQLNSDLGGMSKVYVAATNIPSRTLLTNESVTTIEIPNKIVKEAPNSYVTNPEELAGQILVTPVSEGAILTPNNLKQVIDVENENSRLVQIYQSGKVYFDFFLNEVETGDLVDIVVSHSFDGEPMTEIFMKAVQVKRVHKNEDQVLGIEVEIKVEEAPELIHMQNYADSMRVLKANVAQSQSQTVSKPAEETESKAEAEIQESTTTGG